MFSNDISRQRPQNRSCVGPESVEGSRDSRALSRECTGLLLPGQSPPRSWGGLPGQPLAYSSGKCKYYWFSSQQTLNRFQWSNLDKVAYHLNDGKRESVSHSDVPDSATPMVCSTPGSSVHGILQARIPEWATIPFSGDLPNPGIGPRSHTLQADSLLSALP